MTSVDSPCNPTRHRAWSNGHLRAGQEQWRERLHKRKDFYRRKWNWLEKESMEWWPMWILTAISGAYSTTVHVPKITVPLLGEKEREGERLGLAKEISNAMKELWEVGASDMVPGGPSRDVFFGSGWEDVERVGWEVSVGILRQACTWGKSIMGRVLDWDPISEI